MENVCIIDNVIPIPITTDTITETKTNNHGNILMIKTNKYPPAIV